jgi:hypothetical protein
MIRDYKQVIEGLQALSEAPQTTRGQSELLKGAILVILELQKDLKSTEWLIEKLESSRILLVQWGVKKQTRMPQKRQADLKNWQMVQQLQKSPNNSDL